MKRILAACLFLALSAIAIYAYGTYSKFSTDEKVVRSVIDSKTLSIDNIVVEDGESETGVEKAILISFNVTGVKKGQRVSVYASTFMNQTNISSTTKIATTGSTPFSLAVYEVGNYILSAEVEGEVGYDTAYVCMAPSKFTCTSTQDETDLYLYR